MRVFLIVVLVCIVGVIVAEGRPQSQGPQEQIVSSANAAINGVSSAARTGAGFVTRAVSSLSSILSNAGSTAVNFVRNLVEGLKKKFAQHQQHSESKLSKLAMMHDAGLKQINGFRFMQCSKYL